MAKRVTTAGMFTALALAVSYIEVLIPIPTGIPGVKIGLANCVIMVLLFLSGWKQALCVSILRILIAGFLFGNPVMMIYSLCGGMLSLAVMVFLKHVGGFSPVGISAAGGAFHNIGQISAAVVLMENVRIYYYIPVLLVTGTLTGIAIGILTGELIKKIPSQLFDHEPRRHH